MPCWKFCTTLDPALEDDLRAGADHFPAARTDLAHLLRESGRGVEARAVLERGAKLGEQVAWLPLGNLYREDLDAEGCVTAAIQALYDAADDDSATGGPDLARRIFPVVHVITADGGRRFPDDEVAAIADRIIAARMQRPDGPAAALT